MFDVDKFEKCVN